MSREYKFRIYSFVSKYFIYFDVYEGVPQGIAGGVSEPQEYTGLKDKDGKEIYCGDIVELHTAANDKAKDVKGNHCGLYEIYWDRYYKLKTIKPNWFFVPTFEGPAADYNIMKVVGNIFENKELLKTI
ncbi:putative YopX domain-containing protein [Gammaproteobacteria bacterium]